MLVRAVSPGSLDADTYAKANDSQLENAMQKTTIELS